MTLNELKDANKLVEIYKKRLKDIESLKICYDNEWSCEFVPYNHQRFNSRIFLTRDEQEIVIKRLVSEVQKIKNDLILLGIDVKKL